MATNVEIKARVRDPEALRARVQEVAGEACEIIEQEDTFFFTHNGRLKLRILSPDLGQLIHYEREDERGPKSSFYLISETTDPVSLKALLAASLGVRGVVRKTRRLHMIGRTRIHLDEVDGLGSFAELEVVLDPGESEESGERIAHDLMEKLEIEKSDLVDGAYIDLIERRAD
jgi:adenylate cyclase